MAHMSSYIFLAVRTLAVVVIAASAWPLVADLYDGLLVRVASTFSPAEIDLRAANGRIYVDFLSSEPGTGLSIHGFVSHFGLILVMALVATTPRLAFVKAMAWLVAVAALFSVMHIVGLSLFVLGLRSPLQGEEQVVTVGGTMAAFAIFWALLPAAVGGAWCYRYWLPALQTPTRKSPDSLGQALEER